MGQFDILEFLNEHPKRWYSAMAIATSMNSTVQQIRNATVKLKKFNFVDVRVTKMRNDHRQGRRPVYQYRAKVN